ncbi:MAG: hypothetical protein ABFD97_05710 [Syntrophobacter sp.]
MDRGAEKTVFPGAAGESPLNRQWRMSGNRSLVELVLDPTTGDMMRETKVIRPRTPFSAIVISIFCVAILISTVSAYDGPVGVTFRAPLIEKGAGIDAIRLEGIVVRVKVRIDSAWSFEKDGKDRAFPTQFVPTIADSDMTFALSNRGGHKIKTNILIPFDASDTSGTGFREPLSIVVSLGGKSMKASRGPELPRGMMKVRSFRVPVEIPAGEAVELKVAASHQLAVNPAWYQFACANAHGKLPNYRSLTPNGCFLEFEFDSADQGLRGTPFTCRWKKASQAEPLARKDEKIKFSSDAIEWVRVFR